MTDLFAYIAITGYLICAMLALIVILMLDRRW